MITFFAGCPAHRLLENYSKVIQLLVCYLRSRFGRVVCWSLVLLPCRLHHMPQDILCQEKNWLPFG